MKISAVVNTYNEELNISRCLNSVQPYVDEMIVVDMQSTDKTVQKVKQFTKKIFKHPYLGYVEPARNFAISKALGDWIFLIDADEIITETLGIKLKRLAEYSTYNYFRIPRKNIVFGKWLQHSGWWPDYQIRFFKKDTVVWQNEIHSIPITEGKGTDIQAEEKNALLHFHYNSIEQYLERLNRYTSQEVEQQLQQGIAFDWKNMFIRPADEFLRRFFVWEGYKDGIHGLVLSLLQSFSFLISEIKLWQAQKFINNTNEQFLDNVRAELKKIDKNFNFWYFKKNSEGQTVTHKLISKFKTKMYG